MSKHHVRSHHWVNGILNTIEHFFDNHHEAVKFAESSDAHTIKVYSPMGELLHVKTPIATESYA